jgi:hypothetical protein
MRNYSVAQIFFHFFGIVETRYSGRAQKNHPATRDLRRGSRLLVAIAVRQFKSSLTKWGIARAESHRNFPKRNIEGDAFGNSVALVG